MGHVPVPRPNWPMSPFPNTNNCIAGRVGAYGAGSELNGGFLTGGSWGNFFGVREERETEPARDRGTEDARAERATEGARVERGTDGARVECVIEGARVDPATDGSRALAVDTGGRDEP